MTTIAKRIPDASFPVRSFDLGSMLGEAGVNHQVRKLGGIMPSSWPDPARRGIVYAHADGMGYAYCRDCTPQDGRGLVEYTPDPEDVCETCGRGIVDVEILARTEAVR